MVPKVVGHSSWGLCNLESPRSLLGPLNHAVGFGDIGSGVVYCCPHLAGEKCPYI